LNLKTLYVFDETVMPQDKRLEDETPVLVDPTDPSEYGPEVQEPADIEKHIEAAEKNFIEAADQEAGGIEKRVGSTDVKRRGMEGEAPRRRIIRWISAERCP
jgi:hypothetical protein